MGNGAVTVPASRIPRCPPARSVAKEVFERPLAMLLLVAAIPAMLLIALLVRASGPGPIIHRRKVVGQYGRSFDAFKFRTMVTDADEILARDSSLKAAFAVNHKLQEDPRVTSVGRLLRRYSLDELPQLFNVLRGEMWLVGPRMISPDELPKYGLHVSKLMSVKPGLTGLWQVSGRQETSYETRVRLDMDYIDNWTFGRDLSILWRTLGVVLNARGAY
jgi:lipopolysaccharide/colanic/teichoic acid biosynthesis glycosyltransferase